jgi:hypothetical protein
MNGIELFFAAIREGREPNASVAQVLPCYRVLHQMEEQLAKRVRDRARALRRRSLDRGLGLGCTTHPGKRALPASDDAW